MATTKFYLDCRGKAKDGKGSVLITIYHNATTTTVATGIRVSPSNWQNEKVVKVVGAETINAQLQEQKLKIDKAIAFISLNDNFSTMTASGIKKEIGSGVKGRSKGHLVSTLFQEYMENSDLKDGTRQIYRITLQKVLAFGGDAMRIESLNVKWLRSFEQFLAKTQGVNGRAIYLRHLRAVCKYAELTKAISEQPFDFFHIKHEETQKLCISISDLRLFRSYPTTQKNSYYRDYFLLMLYLIGINSKDLLLAKKSQVVNGRLEYIRAKTGKRYSIKIEPEAQLLLDRYEGKGEYLLEAMDHCKHYKSFSREINDSLRLIGEETEEEVILEDDLFAEPVIQKKVVPIVPGIRTNFARHTWATLAYEIGISSDVISQAMGHSFVNRTTLIYIKFDQQKVDEANRKVIDYFIQSE